MSKNITIVINTMNKPRMLYAMLNYHAKVKIQCPIIVVDASDLDIFEINSSTIMALKNSLAVEHVVPEDRTTFASISFGANLVATKYVVLSGDDDFFANEARACASLISPSAFCCISVSKYSKISELNTKYPPLIQPVSV